MAGAAPQLNLLARIVAERQADAARARETVPEKDLRRRASARRHHSLVDRLRKGRGRLQVIAEIKKASPSAGLLRAEYHPAKIAGAYAAAGAAGISVLTEPRHFQGSGRDLEAVRAAVDLPVLCKDFVVDPYQVAEAASWGADVVLLIVAALAPEQLAVLHGAARELGLEVLVEAHTADELRTALQCGDAVVGVNSRDLKTLRTDLRTARELVATIPHDRLAIAESGIKTKAEMVELQGLGYQGFLIGESLLRQGEPGANLRALLG